jgi:hypothetical protein
LTSEQDLAGASEARCHLLGDLAARAAEDQERRPDLRQWVEQWVEIDRALSGVRGFRRRQRWVLVVPALAALGLAFGIGARSTLGHQERDCFLARNGNLSVADARAGTVVFDDGTRITLAQATRGNLRAIGFRRGAELMIDSGHAELSVVHRWIGRWEVNAGPFAVHVTGTRFAVDWAPGDNRFKLRVLQGEVEVSGCSQSDRMPVRSGQRLEANGTTACLILDNVEATPIVPGKTAPAQLASAVAVDQATTESSTGHRTQRKRSSSTGRVAIRTMPLGVAPEVQADTASIMPEAVFRDWRASAAADDDAATGSGQTTIGDNSYPTGDNPGFVRAIGGSGTKFSAPASKAPGHWVSDGGLLCTHGRIAEITCVDTEDQPRKCDWDTNWGVHMEWFPRPDRKAWGSRAASKIAIEFHGKSGTYQLVAHRHGDPDERWYCVQDYRSGRTVKPSDFSFSCRSKGGSSLHDFATVDQFALQVTSQETPVAFGICLSAITLY